MHHSSNSPGPDKTVVWDIYIRIFHWSLVSFFIIAYVTEDDWLYLHSFAGYSITGLLIFRLFWGLIGTRYARFSSFVTHPRKVLGYVKTLFSGHPKHYTGHNPAGGIMILLLIIFLLLTAVTGMATLATEGLGPLANTFLASMSDDWFEDIHEALANLVLLLIGVHIAGVVVSSVLHRENLIRAMFDGRKAAQQEES
ncbi:MAG: cytochrome b/b6 domain-containing protein [Motiliproteus sp.]